MIAPTSKFLVALICLIAINSLTP